QHPRYSTELVAEKRSSILKADMIVFDDVLSVEQYWKTKNKGAEPSFFGFGQDDIKSHLINISETEINFGLSSELLKQMREVLENKLKVILYYPKGGWSSSVICSGCGIVVKCVKCGSIPVVSNFNLYCPSCGKAEAYPERCPVCKRHMLKKRGFGREHIASFLRSKFDKYTVSAIHVQADSREKADTLRRFESGNTDILLTDSSFSMLSNWDRTGIFAVLDADYHLYGNDWSAEENTFRWIRTLKYFIQSKNSDITLIVQTRTSSGITAQALGRGDEFYEEQLKIRRKYGFPPFSRLIKVRTKGEKSKESAQIINRNMCSAGMEASLPTKTAINLYEIIVKAKNGDIEILNGLKSARVSIEEET
ncbi:MAG: hypothetical protein ABIH42_04610, partial [Planctomycetota bacterium]